MKLYILSVDYAMVKVKITTFAVTMNGLWF